MEKHASFWSTLLRRERERLGWSQARLADKLSVSPKTVGRWERGEGYPSLEFRAILRQLFKEAAEQVEPPHAEGNGHIHEALPRVLETPAVTRPPTRSHIDWGEALHVQHLYGREEESELVKMWALQHECNVIAILGTGGIGKSALAVAVTGQLQDKFDFVFWRSLKNASAPDTILQKCLLFFSNGEQTDIPDDIEDKITLLLEYLRRTRCLIILDNLETVLQSGDESGTWQEHFEGYGKLLKRLGETQHASCLLLTSREKPKEIVHIEGSTSLVHSLRLKGLEVREAQQMLAGAALFGSEEAWKAFIYLYSGNPLALKLVSGTVRELFRGDIARFLKEGMAVFGDVSDLMDQQFYRLSTAEQEILYWLAIAREPISLDELREDILRPLSRGTLLKALDSLQRKSMIEMDEIGRMGLQPVIMEYVTDVLIEKIYREIERKEPKLLTKHALLKANVKEYIRESQRLLILTPLAQRLLDTYGKEELEEHFKEILSGLQKIGQRRPGYAAGNILNLLLHMQFNVEGYDFSHLQLRQAYLQNRPLFGLNLSHAEIVSSTFTDTFGSILSVAFSPDGALLAAGTASCDVRIWQTSTANPLLTLKGHDHWVWSVAFSPDGRLLASASIDQRIRIWSMPTGTFVTALEGHTNRVRSVAFSPDSQLAASGSNDMTVRVWHVRSGECLHKLEGHTGWVWSVAFSHDGYTLVSASSDHTIRLWDSRTGQCLRVLQGHTGWIMSVAFSPDGLLLASGAADQTIRIWDVVNGQCTAVLSGHASWVRTVAFAANGYVIASGSDDQCIRLWDIRTERCLTTLQGHMNWVRAVAFSPDGTMLASGGEDQTVRLWDLATEHCLATFQGYVNGITSTAVSPGGRVIASGSEDRTVRLWSVESGECLNTFHGHTGWVWSVAFNPIRGRHLLASGSIDQTIRLWETHTGECLRILLGHDDWIWSVAFNPTGEILASGSEDQTVRLWDVASGECLRILRGHTSYVGAVIFSTDGSTLASSSGDSTIRLWDVKTGACINILQEFAEHSWAVAFSPENNVLASVGTDQAIHFWELETKHSVNTLQGHTNWIRSITFNADGSLLASSGYDQTIRLWDVQSGTCIHTLQGHEDWVRSVAFSPEGRYLVSGSKDGTIKYWDVVTGTCVKELRNLKLYEKLNISGVQGISEAQKSALKTLGAIVESAREPVE